MTKKKIFIIVILVIVAMLVAHAFLRGNRNGVSFLSKVNCQLSQVSCPWYAVHLNNGQVYFGHIFYVSNSTISLSDTYSLEAYTQGENSISTSSNFMVQKIPTQVYNLTRRGDEKTLSSDHVLYINRQAVLFWEKLTSNSDVVKMIGESVKNN